MKRARADGRSIFYEITPNQQFRVVALKLGSERGRER